MLCLKKVYTEDVLQLAILLSLVRYRGGPTDDLWSGGILGGVEVGVVDDRRFGIGWGRSPGLGSRIHPKSVDSLLWDYQEEVLSDLNSLGRYNWPSLPLYRSNVTAYVGLTNRPSTSTAPDFHDDDELGDLDDVLAPDDDEEGPLGWLKDGDYDSDDLTQEPKVADTVNGRDQSVVKLNGRTRLTSERERRMNTFGLVDTDSPSFAPRMEVIKMVLKGFRYRMGFYNADVIGKLSRFYL
ncbi:hypothetical protein AAG570_003058 [Ranatra chinensis]|uniref:Uncharacterized protein n=1 Tax=Ranatra chinensis TaxID=642074 RepID=A0ABD0Y5N6_9HEMI